MSNQQRSSVSHEALNIAAGLTAEQLAQVSAEREAFANGASQGVTEGESETVEFAPFSEAFQASLDTLTEAHALTVSERAVNKAERDAAAKAETSAQRSAAWLIVDAIAALNDPQTRVETGERMALAIATARGVSEKSEAVYAMRGRDVALFLSRLIDAAKPHKVTRGERKGEEVSGRETSDPLTLCKRYREQRDDNVANEAEQENYMPEAMRLAAEFLGISESALTVRLAKRDKNGKPQPDAEATLAVHSAMADAKAKVQAVVTLRATLETLSLMTDETKAEAIAMVGGFVLANAK